MGHASPPGPTTASTTIASPPAPAELAGGVSGIGEYELDPPELEVVFVEPEFDR